MFNGRFIQLTAGATMLGSFIASGSLLPAIVEVSERHTLRYTNTFEENAPPEVVLGNAIGALRGIIVDVLWVRATMMKERGLYYEANTLADMITKLQPRFAPVWTMHGHNMAYNISVATNTEAERWEWVRKGIDLVRLRGLRHNPNNIELYKDLSYWFDHKIEGIQDDANLFYKQQLCREWHLLLGPPPYDQKERTEWMRKVAEAPESLEEAIARTPLVAELVEKLEADLSAFEKYFRSALDQEFLDQYTMWQALGRSWYGRQFEMERGIRERAEEGGLIEQGYVAFDKLARDPAYTEAWDTLIAYLRKKILRENYNMDAEFMLTLHEKWGPIDWRHASAHALYWAQMGEEKAEARSRHDDDIYKIINNDRMSFNAMQHLARFGLMQYDPIANEFPARLADTRWYDAVEEYFVYLYQKHKHVRGWGPDNFIAGHEHFMQSAVRELYRLGDLTRAEKIYARLDKLYGTGHTPPTPKYSDTLENFVMQETTGEYEMQPHIATTDVHNSLYHGIRFGLALGNEEVYEHSKKFAHNVLTWFKKNDWNEFTNKFGKERISGIIQNLESVELAVWGSIMLDPTIDPQERFRLWNVHMPLKYKYELYDDIREPLQRELENGAGMRGALAQMPFDNLLPEPPGMAEYREQRLERIRQRQREQQGPGATPTTGGSG